MPYGNGVHVKGHHHNTNYPNNNGSKMNDTRQLTAHTNSCALSSTPVRKVPLLSAACFQQQPATDSNSPAQTVAINSASSGKVCSMLDLVAGFDNHAASLNSTRKDITTVLESRPSSTTWPQNSHFFAGSIGESPYITSRSFDEMHKCLGGIDIPSPPSHLDLNETGAQTKQPTLSAESPYITSKSFDDMHKFGIGLSSSAMSHIDLGDSFKTDTSQGNCITETPSVHTESHHGTGIFVSVDPRSDKLCSAFSPFDGNRFIQEHETSNGNFDAVIRGVVASVEAQRNNERTVTLSRSNVNNAFETHLSSYQRSDESQQYSAPSEFGLAKFLSDKDVSGYTHAVSTESDRSSDREVSSSPDCADAQSE